jgi:hypothetical protein
LGRFGPFRYCTKVDAQLAELVPLSDNFAKESRVGIFSQRTHPVHSIEPKTLVLRHFRPFRYCTKADAKLAEHVPLTQKFAKQSCVRIFRNKRMFSGISDHFVTAQKSMRNWPNWCHYRARSLNKVASEFFATNAPDPLHLTQNSCFGTCRNISLLHKSRCKTGRTCAINAKVHKRKLRRNFSQRTHPIHSIGPKTHVLGRFAPFRYGMKVDAKLAELVPLSHTFAKQSRVGIFHNKRTRSTPLDSKLMFWGIWTISLLHESRCKTGRTRDIIAQVR